MEKQGMERSGRESWHGFQRRGMGREAWRDRQGLTRGLLVFVVIVLLSTGLSPHGVPQAFAHQDKLHHLLGFFVFALALRTVYPRLDPGVIFMVGAGVTLFIELGQAMVPMRTTSGLDFAAGLAGSLFGSAAWQPWAPMPSGDEGGQNP